MNKKLKIIFAGTPEIAKVVLENIINNDIDVSLVLTQPDRPAGRGMKLTPSAVKELALQNGIEVFQPISFRKDPDAIEKIRDINADIMVVVAYGLILPKELLSIPKLGCVNIHVSLLPRWRGAAPIQRAVLEGDDATGIAIMQMDEGLDTGDILLLERVFLDKKETSGSLHDKLAKIGADKIVEFLINYDKYTPQKQSEVGVSYAHKLDKEEARINWSESAELIERKIRGYNPFPGAFSFLGGVLHKIWSAEVINNKNHGQLSGTIIKANDKELHIACGDNSALAILEIQEAGSKRKNIAQYLQGKTELFNKVFVRNEDE
ncbi:MAG: methionyl-tRNA formyltransferase [Burkholderiales bacterium]|nr:methionyl-tRNA formyltransferase [Burkholderiales bacterium]